MINADKAFIIGKIIKNYQINKNCILKEQYCMTILPIIIQ